MQVREYFKKIKEVEISIEEPFPLIVSLATTDGGKPGTIVEVSRQEAAKAIVDLRAVLATAEQKEAYLAQEAAKKSLAEKAEMSKRLQIAIVSDTELRTAVLKKEKEKEAEPKSSK